VISLTETTASKRSTKSFADQGKNGFNILEWSDSGRSYIAISDLNAAELETFTKLFRQAG
jgi:hypothetical protein